MANLNMDLPSFDDVDDKKQRKQIKNYLFSLNEQLRYVLNHLDSDNFSNEVNQQLESITKVSKALDNEISALSESGALLKSKITQTEEMISSEVSRASAAEGVLSSQISQTAEEISLKVSYNGIISAINQTAEQIQILASKIKLEGYTTINGGFSIDKDGTLYTSGDMYVENVVSMSLDYKAKFNQYGIEVRNRNNNALLSQMSTNDIYAYYVRCTSLWIDGREANSVFASKSHSHNQLESAGPSVSLYSNTFRPELSNELMLGSPSYLWTTVYAASSSISTSDRDEKNSIADLGDVYKTLILKLKPVKYKYNKGTSNRWHTGFISQDVESIIEELKLTSLDLAAFIKSPKYEKLNKDGEYDTTSKIIGYHYGLRYEEFIAPAISVIQNQQTEIESLKSEIKLIKEILSRNGIA